LRAAASATARGYFTPLNVSGTEVLVVALPGRPGTVSRWPGWRRDRVEIPLALAIAETDVRWRIAMAPRVSPERTVYAVPFAALRAAVALAAAPRTTTFCPGWMNAVARRWLALSRELRGTP
jgi:hypothetical protein